MINRRAGWALATGGALLVLLGIFGLPTVLDGGDRKAPGLQTTGQATVHAMQQVAGSRSIGGVERAASSVQSPPTPWYRSRWVWGVCAVAVIGLALCFVRKKRWATLHAGREADEAKTGGTSRAKDGRTEQRYARELARTNETLRDEVENKTALLEAAAHDLKNPFFGIQALAEIVLETESLSPQSERKLRLIRQSADDALNVINDLMRSAAEAHTGRANFTVLDAGRLVEWVVQGFQPQAEGKGQRLRCEVDDSASCLVEGDRPRLREAVSNLVSNALKYSPPAQSIDVVVDRHGDQVRIAVTDEGPGLSEKDQARMFAPFQRLSPDPTGGESASGLGLYRVQQLVELHRGRIEVDSAVGQGSTFSIVLPVVRRPDVTS